MIEQEMVANVVNKGAVVVIGLGKTGYSCVRFLKSKGKHVVVCDTREYPPFLGKLLKEFADVEFVSGQLSQSILMSADEIVLSPGLSLREPAIQAALVSGVSVIGDIDLFCREVSAPIVAITGSNAKSTVTTLVGEMARAAGVDVAIGGNIGTPVLDLIEESPKQLYVLELSSFQLETTHELTAEASTVLNICPDHMDRYESLDEYTSSKLKIYRKAKNIIFSAEDVATRPDAVNVEASAVCFGFGQKEASDFWVQGEKSESVFMFKDQPLMAVRDMKMKGRHSALNAMAAMALARAVGIEFSAVVAVLEQFAGLEHRCQWVRAVGDITFFNDSKGTNVGASIAAIEGLGSDLDDNAKLILIAGGDGKGADFNPLNRVVAKYVRAVVLIGVDAWQIKAALSSLKDAVSFVEADSMADAVKRAVGLARPKDVVLLSPACASFDMFKSFEHRGDEFVNAVEAIAA